MYPTASVDDVDGLDKVDVLSSGETAQRFAIRPSRGRHNTEHYGSIVSSIVPLLSHDIRHHLSVVLCNAEFMSGSTTTEADRKQLLEEVKLATQHMIDLLDLMLRNARDELQSVESIQSFNELIQCTVDAVRCHPDAAGVRISIAESPMVKALFNKTIVGSAIYNILLNACFAAKQGREPGVVQVSLRENLQFVHILVTDNGSGIPAGLRRSLFEPFKTSGKPGGLGLGLTIAEYVAREYGGRLKLKISRPGCTVFDLKLAKAMLPVSEYSPSSTSLANVNNRRSPRSIGASSWGAMPAAQCVGR